MRMQASSDENAHECVREAIYGQARVSVAEKDLVRILCSIRRCKCKQVCTLQASRCQRVRVCASACE
eukprot:3067190-Pleurochrysis_carterae.AAC.2